MKTSLYCWMWESGEGTGKWRQPRLVGLKGETHCAMRGISMAFGGLKHLNFIEKKCPYLKLRWFGAGLAKLSYLCYLSWDLNVPYVK